MVPPAFIASPFPSGEGRGEGKLGVRCNGRSRLPYSMSRLGRDLLLRKRLPFDCRTKRGAQGKGEGEFTAFPVVSHRPTTF